MKKFTMTLVAIGASGLAIAQTPAPKVPSVQPTSRQNKSPSSLMGSRATV